jgi:hypothetical protein
MFIDRPKQGAPDVPWAFRVLNSNSNFKKI